MALATLGGALLLAGCSDGPCEELEALVDSRDGNQYSIVAIGEQCWMAENLRYLPEVGDTVSNSEPRYYVWGYRGADVGEAKAFTASDALVYRDYGVLYNWPAAATPSGTGC
ncbi:MAG: FISUMP domain-containing protein [Myxococcales bacterium]